MPNFKIFSKKKLDHRVGALIIGSLFISGLITSVFASLLEDDPLETWIKKSPFDKTDSIPPEKMTPWQYLKAHQKLESINYLNDLNDILYNYRIKPEIKLESASYSQADMLNGLTALTRIKEVSFSCLLPAFNPELSSLEESLYLKNLSGEKDQEIINISPEKAYFDKDKKLWNVKYNFILKQKQFESLRVGSKLIFLSRLKIDQENYCPAFKNEQTHYIGCSLNSDYNLYPDIYEISGKIKKGILTDFKLN